VSFTREEINTRLRENISKRIPIIGTGAGTGISAKFEEKGGSDLIIIYNSGRFRMAGRSSSCGLLPFGDANAIVMEMAGEVLPMAKNTPVLAGVTGTDPFRNMRLFLEDVRKIGFSGIQNFPSVGSFDGRIREEFEQTGLGFENEVDMIRIANEMNLFSSPYAWNTEEAEAMTEAGADVIVAHCGCTLGGSIGMSLTISMEEAVKLVQDIHDAAISVNPDVIVLCHGGPIASWEDAQYVLQNTKGIHGFYGASSAERLPVEQALLENMKNFKSITY
jgi:Predicted TIM-barrel enzyme, possibly a dioxygenase